MSQGARCVLHLDCICFWVMLLPACVCICFRVLTLHACVCIRFQKRQRATKCLTEVCRRCVTLGAQPPQPSWLWWLEGLKAAPASGSCHAGAAVQQVQARGLIACFRAQGIVPEGTAHVTCVTCARPIRWTICQDVQASFGDTFNNRPQCRVAVHRAGRCCAVV